MMQINSIIRAMAGASRVFEMMDIEEEQDNENDWQYYKELSEEKVNLSRNYNYKKDLKKINTAIDSAKTFTVKES